MRLRTFAVLVSALGFAAQSVQAAAPDFKHSVDLRVRWESFDTPAFDTTRDQEYSFTSARLRLGGDLKWQHFTLHGMLQGATSVNLPENGAFGAGVNYYTINGNDTDASQVDIAELNAAWRTDDFQVVVGRQPWNDGLETMTGVEYLDGVKRRRVGDRLVGVWDWPNVGRRYDGVSFGVKAGESAHVAGFGLRPLAGGFNYRDAFEQLDGLEVYGLTLTGKYDTWVPDSEVRLFGIRYQDERRGAVAAAGDEVALTTIGASLLAGNERNDLLLWVATQGGDWGLFDKEGYAYIVEAGHEFRPSGPDRPSGPNRPGKLAARIGLAQASGNDASTSGNETFFNLLPTNHKFYGSMDYFAFSNLQTAYLEAIYSRGTRWNLRFAADAFWLTDRDDAIYVGSGAFDAARLGYTLRRPSQGGAFRERGLGTEIDLEAGFALRKDLRLGAGVGLFFAGPAWEESFPVEGDGSWTYVQLTWTR